MEEYSFGKGSVLWAQFFANNNMDVREFGL
jgi:hypothetical protein